VPHTLLLADDSVTIQRVIELTFADEDIKVVAVSDGDQAIDRLQGAPPDIVLADIGMPGKDGYEVAQYIRQHPNLSHIPVVLLTGAFEPVDQARVAQAGCDGVLAKPFEPQLVIGRVKELLAKGHNAASIGDTTIAASPAAGGSPVKGATAAAEPPPLDEYFDRLDAAFSTVSKAPTPAVESVVAPEPTAAAPAEGPPEIDWFSAAPAPATPAEPWDVPSPSAAAPAPDFSLSYASPRTDFAAPPAPADVDAPAELSEPVLAQIQAEFAPSLQDTEAAMPAPSDAPVTGAPATSAAVHATGAAPAASQVPAVAADEMPTLGDAFAALLAAEHGGAPAAEWPGTGAGAVAPPVTDAMLDEVVRRVVERMADTIVRETAAEVVSKIAEEMVKAEIEKIKASIK
jgi:CheY-like chemotaxis protein